MSVELSDIAKDYGWESWGEYFILSKAHGEFHLSKNGLFFVCASCSRNTPIIENNKLRGLLKECVPYVTFKVNIEKNIGCTPSGAYLLIRIKDALGESEDDIERLYK